MSAGALIVVIQTPGLSQFFGCRPLGPVGWITATAVSAAVTGASIVLPWGVERIGERTPRRAATEID